MAKKLFFFLFFCAFHLTATTNFAANRPNLSQNKTFQADECSVPPPDSFRITCVSTNFISLAWSPSWIGATHTLAILNNDGSGGWIPVDTLYNVAGSSYIVPNLQSGLGYRFVIATNCTFGEPSKMTAIIDGITLILDLVIGGRTPIDPVPVDCHNIDFTNHEWVGFRVEETGSTTSIANIFELRMEESEFTNNNFFSPIKIKRVTLNHPIVAVTQDGLWPTPFIPIYSTSNPFRIDRLINGGPERIYIGYVQAIQQPTIPPTIDLCADYNNLLQKWHKFYKFTALTAENATYIPNSPGGNERSENNLETYCKITAQSPFTTSLNIFLPKSYSGNEKSIIRLLNTNGQTVMVHHLAVSASLVSFAVEWLTPGIYILHVESSGEAQTLKVLKSE